MGWFSSLRPSKGQLTSIRVHFRQNHQIRRCTQVRPVLVDREPHLRTFFPVFYSSNGTVRPWSKISHRNRATVNRMTEFLLFVSKQIYNVEAVIRHGFSLNQSFEIACPQVLSSIAITLSVVTYVQKYQINNFKNKKYHSRYVCMYRYLNINTYLKINMQVSIS